MPDTNTPDITTRQPSLTPLLTPSTEPQPQATAPASELSSPEPLRAPHFDPLQFARQFVQERLSSEVLSELDAEIPATPGLTARTSAAETAAAPPIPAALTDAPAPSDAPAPAAPVQSNESADQLSTHAATSELATAAGDDIADDSVAAAGVSGNVVDNHLVDGDIDQISNAAEWIDIGSIPDEVNLYDDQTPLPPETLRETPQETPPTNVYESVLAELVIPNAAPAPSESLDGTPAADASPAASTAVEHTAPEAGPALRKESSKSKARSADRPPSELSATAKTAGETSEPPIPLKDVDFRPQIHISGYNSALNRASQVQTFSIPLFEKKLATTKWTPFWGKIATYGLTFPEGFEFLPTKTPREPAEEGAATGESAGLGPTKEELLALLAPVAVVDGEAVVPEEPPVPEKKTRLKPPHDAVSVEDRLFYLLQPPLETWLKGQELIMPFEPFPYQYEGIAWLFAQQAALLADEMGLGKTMQTITAMRLLLRAGQVNRILLVCPKPLIPNWQREFKNWAEELPVVTIEGDSAHRKMQWTMPGVPILLANYEVLTRDFEMLADDPPHFDLLILDEAQRIKNRTSRTAITARAIPRKRSWALTGTPIENRPEEMASLYEFMEVIPQAANPDLRQLQKLSKSYVLRRTKDLVMKDLPPRFDREEYLELAPAQKAAYETAEKEGIIQLNEMGESISVQNVFELVLRLKQITNFEPVTGESSKLDRLEADMEEIAASGGKAILFSQWTKTIDYLERKLARFDPLIYHGRIPVKKREPVLKEFKDNPNRSLLMMSYATGAVGLNLQFAGYVFLFDRWWNPAVEDQAINRAHRIGQKTQVIVTKFISKDTIEERIDKVLTQKRELFATVLGEGDNTNVSLSLNASEIFGLFDLKARHGKGTRLIAPPPPPTAEALASDTPV